MASTDCPICYETFANDNFINCSNNHIACCIDCFSKLTNNNCPICRNSLYNETTITRTTTTTTTTTSRLPRLRIQREAREARRQRETNNSNYDSNISNLIDNHRRRLAIQREENEEIINNVFANNQMADTPANRTWARRSLAQSQRRRREAQSRIY